MIPLLILNTPPGLYLQLMVSGILPIVFSKKSIWVKSSRLMIAPILSANLYSYAGVSLEENIICFPSKPWESANISSVWDAQSQPQSYSFKIFKINGFGVAFTAKYSRNPGFHANASFTAFAFSRMPFSS